jgi:hypothetical protein
VCPPDKRASIAARAGGAGDVGSILKLLRAQGPKQEPPWQAAFLLLAFFFLLLSKPESICAALARPYRCIIAREVIRLNLRWGGEVLCI